MVSMDTREGGGRGGHSGYSGNSSGRGRGGRGFSNSNGWQNTNSYPQNTSYAPRGRGRFGGRGGRGGGRGYGANAAPDVEFVSDLRGHRRKVTCLAVDYANSQLLSGSHDGTVRVWDCTSGQCVHTQEVGGEVDSMLVEHGWLFVGVKTREGRGEVKGWALGGAHAGIVGHAPPGTEVRLEGHTGQVTSLAMGNGMLFSGGQDKSIRVWKPSAATPVNVNVNGNGNGNSQHQFECAAVLEQQNADGHRSSISCMTVAGPILFSGDTSGTIKVWDLQSGSIKQTLIKAHRNAQYPAITQLLIWEGHLMSGSLDGAVKIFEPGTDGTNMVNPACIFTHPEEMHSSGGTGGGRGRGRNYHTNNNNGVLAMQGVADLDGKAVLMVSYNTEQCIKLYELPTFADRGTLTHVNNPRAMASFPQAQLLFAGDETGKVKCWKWKAK